MTKQDYVIIASILRDIAEGYDKYGDSDDFARDVADNTMPEIAADFARELSRLNPRFNKELFMKAAAARLRDTDDNDNDTDGIFYT